jgi:ABC-type glutathione transport system ATPase component
MTTLLNLRMVSPIGGHRGRRRDSPRGGVLDSLSGQGSTARRPALRLEGVRKSYGQVVAVAGVDLAVEEGEFFTLLGPSGSSKTTLLRLVTGFERPDRGRIELGDR